MITALISFMASLAVVIVFIVILLATKQQNVHARRPNRVPPEECYMVLSLSVACSLFSLCTSIRLISDDFTCSGQAVIYVLTSLWYILSLTTVGVYHFLQSSGRCGPLVIRWYVHFSILLSWALPISIVVCAYVYGALGSTASISKSFLAVGWCWISEQPAYPLHWSCEEARLLWLLITLKGWEIACYVVMMTSLMFVCNRHRHFKQWQDRDESRQELLSDDEWLESTSVELSSPRGPSGNENATLARSYSPKHMLAFSLVFVISRLPGTVRSGIEYTDARIFDSADDSGLHMTQGICDNMQGIFLLIFLVLLDKRAKNYLPFLRKAHRGRNRENVPGERPERTPTLEETKRAERYRNAMKRYNKALREKLRGVELALALWSVDHPWHLPLSARQKIEQLAKNEGTWFANGQLLDELIYSCSAEAVIYFVDELLNTVGQADIRKAICECPGRPVCTAGSD